MLKDQKLIRSKIWDFANNFSPVAMGYEIFNKVQNLYMLNCSILFSLYGGGGSGSLQGTMGE